MALQWDQIINLEDRYAQAIEIRAQLVDLERKPAAAIASVGQNVVQALREMPKEQLDYIEPNGKTLLDIARQAHHIMTAHANPKGWFKRLLAPTVTPADVAKRAQFAAAVEVLTQRGAPTGQDVRQQQESQYGGAAVTLFRSAFTQEAGIYVPAYGAMPG
jgi:hypothetical protein